MFTRWPSPATSMALGHTVIRPSYLAFAHEIADVYAQYRTGETEVFARDAYTTYLMLAALREMTAVPMESAVQSSPYCLCGHHIRDHAFYGETRSECLSDAAIGDRDADWDAAEPACSCISWQPQW